MAPACCGAEALGIVTLSKTVVALAMRATTQRSLKETRDDGIQHRSL